MSEETSPYRRVSGDFQLGVPRAVLLALLHQHHGPYSHEQACISLMLDRDAGGEKSIRDYVRIWGWTKAKVEYNIGRVREDVDRWEQARRTEPRPPLANRTAAGQQQDNQQDKKRATHDAIDDSQDSEQDDSRTGYRTLTKHTHSQKEEEGCGGDAGARGPAGAPRNPANGFPQEAEVIAFAMQHAGCDEEAARDVFWSLTANAWKRKDGEMYPDWGHATINALRYRKNRNGAGHGSHKQAPPPAGGRQRSAYDQRVATSSGEGLDRIKRNLADMAEGRQRPGRATPGESPRADAAGSDAELEGRTPVGGDTGRANVD